MISIFCVWHSSAGTRVEAIERRAELNGERHKKLIISFNKSLVTSLLALAGRESSMRSILDVSRDNGSRRLVY